MPEALVFLVASDVMDLHLEVSMQRGAEESGTHCIWFFFENVDWWSFRNEYQGVLFLMRMIYDKCGLSAMRCGAVIRI